MMFGTLGTQRTMQRVKNILGLLTVPLTPSNAPATCMACAHVEKLSGISGLTSQVL